MLALYAFIQQTKMQFCIWEYKKSYCLLNFYLTHFCNIMVFWKLQVLKRINIEKKLWSTFFSENVKVQKKGQHFKTKICDINIGWQCWRYSPRKNFAKAYFHFSFFIRFFWTRFTMSINLTIFKVMLLQTAWYAIPKGGAHPFCSLYCSVSFHHSNK